MAAESTQFSLQGRAKTSWDVATVNLTPTKQTCGKQVPFNSFELHTPIFRTRPMCDWIEKYQKDINAWDLQNGFAMADELFIELECLLLLTWYVITSSFFKPSFLTKSSLHYKLQPHVPHNLRFPSEHVWLRVFQTTSRSNTKNQLQTTPQHSELESSVPSS
jgi:hypothetical protein